MLPNPLEEIARKLDEYNKRLSHLERLEAAGAWTLIEDVELTIAAANIDFQNIPAVHSHLQIKAYVRSARVNVEDFFRISFNNDAGNNYDSIRGYIRDVATLITTESIGGGSFANVSFPAASSPANTFGLVDVFINEYAGTIGHKTIRVIGSHKIGVAAGNIRTTFGSGFWRNTAAINRITLRPNSGSNFVAGTRISLYGIN